MKEIQLTQGKFTKVDDVSYEKLSRLKWFAVNYHEYYYAATKINGEIFLMHRIIMSTPDNQIVDHIDHDTLNNQQANLRNCGHRENSINRKPSGCSKYKGVYFSCRGRKGQSEPRIRASIRVGGKLIFLGYHKTEESAALAYDEAAKIYYGEYAFLNF